MKIRAFFRVLMRRVTGSLSTQYIGLLLLAVVLPFSLVILSISHQATTLETDRTFDTFDEALRFVSLSVDNCLSSVDALHASLLLDDKFIQHVKALPDNASPVAYADLQNVRKIKDVLKTTSVRNSAVRNIYLYCPGIQRLFISNINAKSDYERRDMSGSEWFTVFDQQPLFSRWVITQALERDERILSSYRVVVSAMLSLNVSEKTVAAILQDANPYGYASCFLMDQRGNVITSRASDQALVQRVSAGLADGSLADATTCQIDGRQVFLSAYVSAYSGFRLGMCAYEDDCLSVSNSIRPLIDWYVTYTVLLVAFSILLSYLIIVKPILLLSRQMKKAEAGDLSVRLPERSGNEIDQIYHRFNQMNTSIGNLIENNYISEIKRKDFELKLLSSQINEHFLYNALDAIRWAANRESDTLVSESICALASFYRISLSGGADTFFVRDLLCMIENYLQIQKLLLGNTLSYDVSIPQTLFDLKVPKYLFIPLVDNAVQHGVKGVDDGVICVSLMRMDEKMRFQVTDNGRGITKVRLAQIQQALESTQADPAECFALRNLNAQLTVYYKDCAGVQIRTQEGQGTSVWFDIPFSEEDIAP